MQIGKQNLTIQDTMNLVDSIWKLRETGFDVEKETRVSKLIHEQQKKYNETILLYSHC